MKVTSNELKQEVIRQIQNISQPDLLELARQLISSSEENTEAAFLFLEQKGYLAGKKSGKAYEKRYRQILSRLIDLIDDFNTYGGGSEEDEEEVYEQFDTLTELFQGGKISKSNLTECVDLLMKQYLCNNSGLEDTIMDWLYENVEKEADWKRIVDHLASSDRAYHEHLIMQIQRDMLNDDEAYEKMRASNLKYGRDYYEYALFLNKKGQKEKALHIVKEGIEKGEGRMDNLYDYLFAYYDSQHNQEEALMLRKQQFQQDPTYHRYKEIISYVPEAQREQLKEELYEQVTSRFNENVRVKIDFHEKRYDRVLTYVTSSLHINEWVYDNEYEQVLISLYPQEMIAFYKQHVTYCINGRQRTHYRKAAQYAKKIRKIYDEVLHDHHSWEQYIYSVLHMYPKLPALQEELRAVLA